MRVALDEPAEAGDAVVAWQHVLGRLDDRLSALVTAAQDIYGAQVLTDPMRGLYIGEHEADRLFRRGPNEPLTGTTSLVPLATRHPALARLGRRFGLEAFDLDVLLVALAPELDLRYEPIYALLQNDVTRKRPSVDLALTILCATPADRLGRRRHFAPEAPLRATRLLDLGSDAGRAEAPMLARSLEPAETVLRALLDQSGLDEQLAPFCHWVTAEQPLNEVPAPSEVKRGLARLLDGAASSPRRLRLRLRTGHVTDGRRLASACAHRLGRPLLRLSLGRTDLSGLGDALWPMACRDAALADAVLAVEEDRQAPTDAAGLERLWPAAAAVGVPLILCAGSNAAPDLGPGSADLVEVPLVAADADVSRTAWCTGLAGGRFETAAEDASLLADRFRLAPAAVDSVLRRAAIRARWRDAATIDGDADEPRRLDRAELFGMVRAAAGDALGSVASRIEPRRVWTDLVLPEGTLGQLRELVARIGCRRRVFEDWGFVGKLSGGLGLAALFSGPSGTGKTLAAEVVAQAAGLDLYRVNLSSVISKYIGETEKNLERIFDAAEQTTAILFFDEADALFGRRSEVQDAHDRYANIEVSYLLQRMEQYPGVAILASNLRDNLDPAFVRRLAFSVAFPFPDAAQRRAIWEQIWPEDTPRSDDLDLDQLARQLTISGGSIKNIALAAAFLAAEDDMSVAMRHVLRAAQREYQKLGSTAAVPALASLSAARTG